MVSLKQIVEVLKSSGYQAGDVTENTFIVFNGRSESAIEKPDTSTVVPGQASGSAYVGKIAGVTVEKLNQAL